jgi:hypothetical protein
MMKQIGLMPGVALVVAVTACPVLAYTTPASDDEEGVDCLYAENAEDPLCHF